MSDVEVFWDGHLPQTCHNLTRTLSQGIGSRSSKLWERGQLQNYRNQIKNQENNLQSSDASSVESTRYNANSMTLCIRLSCNPVIL